MAQRKTGDEQGRRKDSHEGTPSRDEFARRMMDAIRRAGETRPIRYDPDGFTLVSQKGEYHLANAFRAYCLARDRAKMFRNAVALWFSDMKLPEKYEDVNPDLLPKVVRRTEYDASVLERNGDGGEAHGTMPWLIADHLAVVAAYDLPECIMTLMPQSLAAEWGVSYEKALRDACVNLLEISEGPFENPQPGLYVSPWRDNHDASRLVLTNLIRRLDVKGDHVAMVPNRDTLLVTGSADSAGLARMAELAMAAMDDPYWVSALPVRLTDGGWVRFSLDGGASVVSGLQVAQDAVDWRGLRRAAGNTQPPVRARRRGHLRVQLLCGGEPGNAGVRQLLCLDRRSDPSPAPNGRSGIHVFTYTGGWICRCCRLGQRIQHDGGGDDSNGFLSGALPRQPIPDARPAFGNGSTKHDRVLVGNARLRRLGDMTSSEGLLPQIRRE